MILGSAPAALAKIKVIWFQVRTSSEVMWNASPSVRVLPSRGRKPLAQSSLCVRVHSAVHHHLLALPHPLHQGPAAVIRHRGAVVCVGRPDDHRRKIFLAVSLYQPLLTGDLVPGVLPE